MKDSSNTKGAEYDQTGGCVDDRTFTQKAGDAIKPGSQVGTHRSDVTGLMNSVSAQQSGQQELCGPIDTQLHRELAYLTTSVSVL